MLSTESEHRRGEERKGKKQGNANKGGVGWMKGVRIFTMWLGSNGLEIMPLQLMERSWKNGEFPFLLKVNSSTWFSDMKIITKWVVLPTTEMDEGLIWCPSPPSTMSLLSSTAITYHACTHADSGSRPKAQVEPLHPVMALWNAE